MDGRKNYNDPPAADVIKVLKAAGRSGNENAPAHDRDISAPTEKAGESVPHTVSEKNIALKEYIDPEELLPAGRSGADIRDPGSAGRLEFFRGMAGGEKTGERFHFDAASALKDFRKKNPPPVRSGFDSFADYGKPPGAVELLPEGTRAGGHIPADEEDAELKVFREVGAVMGMSVPDRPVKDVPQNSGDSVKPSEPGRLPVGMSAAVRRFRETGSEAYLSGTDEPGAAGTASPVTEDILGTGDIPDDAHRDIDAMAALKIFREMSGVTGEDISPGSVSPKKENISHLPENIPPGKSADGAAHKSALETVRKLREKGGVIREDVPEEPSESSPIQGEALEFLKMFREMSGAPGVPEKSEVPEMPERSGVPEIPPTKSSDRAADKSALEAVRKLREKGGVIREDVPEETSESSPVQGEALEFLKIFREMSGAPDVPEKAEVPEMPDKPERSGVPEIPPTKSSDRAADKSALEAVRKLREKGGVIREDVPEETSESAPVQGEALEFLKMFREMSGVPGETERADVPPVQAPSEEAAAVNIPENLPEENKPDTIDEPEDIPEENKPDAIDEPKNLRKEDEPDTVDEPENLRKEDEPDTVDEPEDIPEENEPDTTGEPENFRKEDEPDTVDEPENFRKEDEPDTVDEPEDIPEGSKPDTDDEPEDIPEEDEQDTADPPKNPDTYDLNISRRFGASDLPEELSVPEPETYDDPKVFRISWDEEQAARWRAYDPGKPKAEFSSSYKPPIDMEDIPLDGEILAQARAAQERERSKCSLAVCGADCTDCPFGEETDCSGCGGLCEDCDIVQCCAVRGHEHCGLCEYFPCDRLRQAAFDPESGDSGERLVRLKELREAAGSRKKPRMMIAGVSGGVALGAAIGGFSGALAPWLFAGAVMGAGLGAIAGAAARGKK